MWILSGDRGINRKASEGFGMRKNPESRLKKKLRNSLISDWQGNKKERHLVEGFEGASS
jgi:hypothetical protein